MWIIKYFEDYLKSFGDLGHGMEWWSLHSPVLSTFIKAAFFTGSLILKVPGFWVLVISGLIVLPIGWYIGNNIYKKIYFEETNITYMFRGRKSYLGIPYNQVQAGVIGSYIMYLVFFYRLLILPG